MDVVKKIFPYSFGAADNNALVVKIIVYVVAAVAAAIVLILAGLITFWIPVLGLIIGVLLRIVGWVVELYVIAGIVLLLLDYFKVIK